MLVINMDEIMTKEKNTEKETITLSMEDYKALLKSSTLSKTFENRMLATYEDYAWLPLSELKHLHLLDISKYDGMAIVVFTPFANCEYAYDPEGLRFVSKSDGKDITDDVFKDAEGRLNLGVIDSRHLKGGYIRSAFAIMNIPEERSYFTFVHL